MEAEFVGRKKKRNNNEVIVSPALNNHHIEVIPHASNAVLTEIIKNDLLVVDGVLAALKEAWRRPMCIDDICKMALTTTKILKDKRELMNQTLGSPRFDPGFSRGKMTVYDD